MSYSNCAVGCDEKAASKRLLSKADLKGYQIGKTKVFLRAGQIAELDTRRCEVLGRSASVIQRKVRSYLCRKSFLLLQLSAIQIQALCRGQVARHLYEIRRREAACLRIQKHARMCLARKSYGQMCSSAVSIQTGIRGMAARNELLFLKQTRAAIIIQSRCRQYLAHLHYLRIKQAAIATQCAWRVRVARRELRKLKMAAKETGALQAAKNTLEKQVEELTQRLQLEKRMRVDLEESKTQETARLSAALQEIEVQFQETKTMLIKEREAAKKEAEKIPVIKEVPVIDHELMNKLTAENENLKALVSTLEEKITVIKEVPVIDHELMNKLTAENENLKALVSTLEDKIDETEKKYEETNKLCEERSQQASDAAENENLKALVSTLEKKIDETEKKYEETSKLCEERLQQALDAESKIIQLKTNMQRLEEKLSDMETEDQILRQQALLKAPSKRMSNRFSFSSLPVENGHPVNEEHKVDEPQSATHAKKFGSESMRKSQTERQHVLPGNVDTLINCVKQDLGFSQGKPVAAFTIYKCLLQWKSFEAERTSVFDRLIHMIGCQIENQEDNHHMAYWLSNTSTLLFLLQRSLKATSGSVGGSSFRKPPTPTSFIGRMTQGFRSSPSSANLSVDVVRQVEAKYPALLFKQQLTAYVEKIYGIIRDNLKKELSPLLSSCIQAPRQSKGSALRSPGRSFKGSPTPPASHWQSIIESLNTLFSTLKDNFVPPVLVQKIFIQIFSYVNVQLFNSLLLRRECCTFSNGEYVKAGLAELELWCGQAKEEYAGSSWDELKHIRQSVGFLVIHQKSRISYDEITNDLCPMLSVQQLYRICTLYCDDDYNTRSVAPEVISSMRVLMTEDSNDADSNSFLLDDNSSIPFSVDDILGSIQEKDFSDVKPAEELLENPAFYFLQE